MKEKAKSYAVSAGVLEKERKRSEPRSVYMQAGQWDALDRIAFERGKSRSELIRELAIAELVKVEQGGKAS